MKTNCILFSLFLTMFIASGLTASARTVKENKETYNCERTITANTVISFKNKTGPLRVETWEKNAVKVDIDIIIDGEDDQVRKAMDYIKRMNFKQLGDTLIFDTRFWKSMNSGSGISFTNFHFTTNQIKVTMPDCEVVTLRRLDLSFVLTIPKNNSLQLTQAYEDVTLPDLSGSISLNLYESNMVAGKLPGCQSIVAKYGKVSIDSLSDAEITLYESNLKLGHAGNLTMNSKYSGTEIVSAGKISLNSYEDKISMAKHGDLSLKAKYTSFNLADFNIGAFDLYECNLKAGIGDVIAMSAKYCNIEFISCKAIALTAYEDKFIAGRVGDLKAGSSYSSFKVTRLDGRLIMTSSYEDKVSVTQVDKKFTGIDMVCKYTEVDLQFEPGTVYKLDADVKYSSFNFPKSSFREIRYHKEDDIFQYIGVTQGSDENTTALVKLQMYEGGAKLK